MPAMPDRSLRISHVGLRGVVGQGLTAAHVVDFASAFGALLEQRRPVVIGRDPRASGTMLRQGVIAGLVATGHDVIDLGMVSTPVIQHAIRRLEAGGRLAPATTMRRVERTCSSAPGDLPVHRRGPANCSTSTICAAGSLTGSRSAPQARDRCDRPLHDRTGALRFRSPAAIPGSRGLLQDCR
jgi:hypothetical protein